MSLNEDLCELKELVIDDYDKSEDVTPTQDDTQSISTHSIINMLSIRRPSSEMSQISTECSSGIHGVANSTSSKVSRSTTAHATEGSTKDSMKVNVPFDQKPPRPPQPNLSKLTARKDATDVRQMEQALLGLLDDFHSGKLRAFGKDCSMEQMTAIHEQQERLARLHFELGAKQDLFIPLSKEGLNQRAENMKSLMSSLEQLSLSIERLHSINNE